MKEARRPAQIVEEQVGKPVVIVINPGGTFAEVAILLSDAGPECHFVKASIAPVVIEPMRLALAADEEVEPAVVVVIDPGRGVGIDRCYETRFGRDIGESTLAVIAQEARPDGVRKPRPPGNEEVQAAVVVVIGLIADQAAELACDPGPLALVLERSISSVAVVRHRLRWIDRRDGQVEQAIAVEVVHDRPTGLIEPVHSHDRANVAKLADVKFRAKKTVKYEPVARIDPLRIFAQRHVGQVQEPLDSQIVGKSRKIFGEVLDRPPRAGRVSMNGCRQNRKNARALTPAHDAIVIFAAPYAP